MSMIDASNSPSNIVRSLNEKSKSPTGARCEFWVPYSPPTPYGDELTILLGLLHGSIMDMREEGCYDKRLGSSLAISY